MARPLPADIAALLDQAADRYGVDRALVRAVAWVESRGRADAISKAGAQGVMQLMPVTAESLGVADPFDPASNIDGGVRFLAKLLRRGPDDDDALAGYCWGPAHVARGDTWPDKVRTYVQRVRTRAELERAVAAGLKQWSGPSSPSSSPSRRPSGGGSPLAIAAMMAMGVVYLFLLQTREGR